MLKQTYFSLGNYKWYIIYHSSIRFSLSFSLFSFYAYFVHAITLYGVCNMVLWSNGMTLDCLSRDRGSTPRLIVSAVCPGGEGAVLKTVGQKWLARSNRVYGVLKIIIVLKERIEMNNYKHTRTIMDTVKIKGVLSEDGQTIIYEKDKEDYSADISDILKQFAGELIIFSIGTKEEKDLED